MIERPGSRREDVGQRMAVNGIWPRDHPDQNGVRSEVGDARKGREVCLSGDRAGPDEANGFRAGQGGGELDTLQFIHGVDPGGVDDHRAIITTVADRAKESR